MTSLIVWREPVAHGLNYPHNQVLDSLVFVDHENRALNIKIAITARRVGSSATELRAWAASLPAAYNGELIEPEAGGIRLLSLDYFLPARTDGYQPHPHLYAVDATIAEPASDYELMSLHHGADAMIDLDALETPTLAEAIAAAIARAIQ